jgi:hypothetical protein
MPPRMPHARGYLTFYRELLASDREKYFCHRGMEIATDSNEHEHRNIAGGIGHNLPQEAPQAFAQAIIDVDGY